MKSIEHCNIEIATLIRVYKEFKRKPEKIFVVNDFFKANPRLFGDRYLKTLVKLNLIEKIPAIYYSGKKYKIRRDVCGYKLKAKIQKENEET